MGRRFEKINGLGLEILGAIIAAGYTSDEAAAVCKISKSAWNSRIHNPGLFRARDIQQLRKIIPDAVCDKISR